MGANPITEILSHQKTKFVLNSVGIILSSDEFRIRLEKIRNSIENVEFEIRTRGRIWSINSNSTKFDTRIWPKVDL